MSVRQAQAGTAARKVAGSLICLNLVQELSSISNSLNS